MVLVNALYFKGLWSKEFKKSNTIKATFWISPKQSVKVPMMRSSGYFNHGSCGDIGASVLSMNYKVCKNKHKGALYRYGSIESIVF